MKANCRALKISIIISIVFFALTIIFSYLVIIFPNKILEILLDIFIGMFGSGFFSLLIAIPTYNVSKRQLLEKYWEETRRLIEKFSSLDFMFIQYSSENMVSYIKELKNKKWKEEFNKIGKEQLPLEDEKYKDLLIKEYTENNKELVIQMSEKGFKSYASDCIDRDVEKIRNKAREIYQQYIEVSKESTIELNFMLGDIQFLSGKKQLKKILDDTYKPLFEKINKIKEESYHFKLFLDGEGNEAIVLEKLLKLQKEIFDIKTKDLGDFKSYTIYNSFSDNMLINLENFRAKIYGIQPDKVELHPVECRRINSK